MEFIGRQNELQSLKNTASLPKASLMVCRGRRRIGKSRLINEFARRSTFDTFVQVQGLAPAPGQTLADQLDNYMQAVCQSLKLPTIKANNWSHAFELLYSFVRERRVLVFLDEISWMGQHDLNFANKLKIAWDTLFSQNPQMMLVLCGSITSWIDQNILHNTNFVGRVSLTLTLRELSLIELKDFLSNQHFSSFEALKLLAVTGGVPRYLEELNTATDAETNIRRLCFTKEGLLFNEFEKIFSDIFDRRAETYARIVETLLPSSLSVAEIAHKLDMTQSGVLSNYIEDLVESGFLRRHYTWNLQTSRTSKLSKISISDNYIRFYLKFIKPSNQQIRADLYADDGAGLPLENLNSILGLQLESLLLNNIRTLIEKLNISPSKVVNFGPYFQNKTKRQAGVQIDLLIQTHSSYYFCEIKSKRSIGLEVVSEMQTKLAKLKLDTTKNIKTVLIYTGKCTKDLQESDYFSHKLQVPEDFW